MKVWTGRRELEALVIGQVELRPDLDLELVDERPLVGDLDLGRVDVGRAERGDVVVLGELFEAGQQHLGLDLVADLLLEAAFDDLARRLAGPEAGHVGVGDQLAELLVEAVVDVRAVDGDLDVLLARADVVDLDRLVELGRLLVLAVLGHGRGGAFGGRGLGGRGFRSLGSGAWVIRSRFVGHEIILPSSRSWVREACGFHCGMRCILGDGVKESSPGWGSDHPGITGPKRR